MTPCGRNASAMAMMTCVMFALTFESARALECRCANSVVGSNAGTCTHATLVDASDGVTACSVLSGTTITANIVFQSADFLTAYEPLVFDLSASGATTFDGNLTQGGFIENQRKMTTVNFGSIQTWVGHVDFKRATKITTITATALTSVYSLELGEVTNAATVGFPALVNITKAKVNVPASGVNYPTALTGSGSEFDYATTFPVLQRAQGINPYNVSAFHLPSLVVCDGYLRVTGGTNVSNLEEVAYLYHYRGTTVNLPKLRKAGTLNFYLDDTHDGTFLVPELQTVTYDFIASGGYSTMSSMTNLLVPKLATVGGNLQISRFDSLLNMSFPALTLVGGESDGAQQLGLYLGDHLQVLAEVHLEACTSYATTGIPKFQVTQLCSSGCISRTPTKLYVACISGLPAYNPTLSEAEIVYPAGCSYGAPPSSPPPSSRPPPPPLSGPPSSGPPSPSSSAIVVTTAELQTAVAACFTESASGACQCAPRCGVLAGPIASWSFTGTNLDLTSLFQARSSFNQPIGNWNVGGATSMARMFKNATSFNQPIGSWRTSSVTDMSQMFYGASSFARDISAWDVARVTSSNEMFTGADAFNAKYTCVGAKCSGDPSSDKLSRGAIAGIAVGCIAAVTIAAIIIYLCTRRRRNRNDEIKAQAQP